MSHGLILIDALSSACWEKNEKIIKKKRKEKWPGAFFPGPEPDTICWLCQAGFSRLLGAIKG
jgi:hypothetical protein